MLRLDSIISTPLLSQKEDQQNYFYCKRFSICLFLAVLCFVLFNHSRLTENRVGVYSVYTGSHSDEFQFFKDNKERFGWWSTCTKNGDCGFDEFYENEGAAMPYWYPPETRLGGSLLLTQDRSGSMISRMQYKIMSVIETKYKMISTKETWRKANEKEKGVIIVTGYDNHKYGLSIGAVEELIKLEDVYKSIQWRALLEPLLPEGLSFKMMSEVRAPLNTIIENDASASSPFSHPDLSNLPKVHVKISILHWDFPLILGITFQDVMSDKKVTIMEDRKIVIHFSNGRKKTMMWKDCKNIPVPPNTSVIELEK